MARKKIEAAIQRELVKWIGIEYPSVNISAAQNENSRHAANMGMDVGRPDLELEERREGILYIFYHELKSKDGVLLSSQKGWKKKYDNRLKAANTHYAVSYGLSEAREAVLAWFEALPSPE